MFVERQLFGVYRFSLAKAGRIMINLAVRSSRENRPSTETESGQRTKAGRHACRCFTLQGYLYYLNLPENQEEQDMMVGRKRKTIQPPLAVTTWIEAPSL